MEATASKKMLQQETVSYVIQTTTYKMGNALVLKTLCIRIAKNSLAKIVPKSA